MKNKYEYLNICGIIYYPEKILFNDQKTTSRYRLVGVFERS